MNNIIAIHPYKHKDVWVFDDPNTELVQEPFVCGIDEIIEEMVKDIPNAQSGFTLLFSSAPFPTHNATLEWRRPDMEGNWYYSVELDREGWLCPALFKYFKDAPVRIYAQFKRGEDKNESKKQGKSTRSSVFLNRTTRGRRSRADRNSL